MKRKLSLALLVLLAKNEAMLSTLTSLRANARVTNIYGDR